jgi:cobyrinic acid a,c-diamide synthase
MRGFLVSAAHKSSGKTTIALGLAAALRAHGLAVQPFKKGPDYIDPLWLAAAAGRGCINLDLYLSPPEEVARDFGAAAVGADVAIVEGNKGLYDGLALDGSNSNAALARLLGLPVVLVLDARGMTRGIAPLILGYQAFDREIRIVGVILNRLGGARHEAKLRAVIEHYTDVPVLGSLQEDPTLAIAERHLGLIPATESAFAAERIERIAQAVAAGIDLDRLLVVAAEFEPVPAPRRPMAAADLRVGIARDRAFGFYYARDLELLRDAGAELVDIDTLHDHRLPAVDALFIGGGFPEMFASELAGNESLRADIRNAIDDGLPVYAECGGLMYLARTLRTKDGTWPMVGALPLDVAMEARPVGRGYVHLEETAEFPWPRRAPHGDAPFFKAHEFHYSRVVAADPALRYAYRVRRGFGIDGTRDGIVHRNVLASYSHLRATAGDAWPQRFIDFVRARRPAQAPRRRAGLTERAST